MMLLVEHRASTMLRQRTLFGAIFSAVFQVVLAILISSSGVILQVSAGLVAFLFPSRFHFKAYLIVSVALFCSVWPIQDHFRPAISVGICSCPVLLQSSLLLIFSSQCILSIFLSLLTKLCRLFYRACVTFQVSDP